MRTDELMSPPPKSSEAGSPIRLRSRADGAMLAAACGDALGWPVEPRGNRVGGTRVLEPQLAFIDWVRREGGRYAPHERAIPAGSYSDDTQLMLAVARSVGLGDEWWQHFTGLELPMWTLYEIGGGGAIKGAAQSWAKGVAPWDQAKPAERRKYFEAGANGVVMRILPHAIHGAEQDTFSPLAQQIVADGIATHGHPRALIGALVAGYAMWESLRWQGKVGYGELIQHCLDEYESWCELPDFAGYAPNWTERAGDALDTDYLRLWTRTVEEMLGLLETCREAMGRGSLARDSKVLEDLGAFGPEGGAGTRTTATAMYLASRYVARPSAGLLAAAFTRKIDTDTVACVAGALLGALSGDDWLDGLGQRLQDASYVRELAAALVGDQPLEVARGEWQPQFKRRLLDRLRPLDVGGRLPLPVFEEGRVSRIEHPETRSANEITIWWLETAIGQHVPITKVTKKPAGKRAAGVGSTAEREKDHASGQLAIAEAAERNDSELDRAQAWMTLLVRDLEQSLSLYRDLLGLRIRRQGLGFAVLHPNLIIEHDKQRGRGRRFERIRTASASSFEASPLVGVRVPAVALEEAHRRVGQAKLFRSQIVQDADGDRFRFEDPDGHIVEVRAAPSR